MFAYTISMAIAIFGMLAQSVTASPAADVSTAFTTAQVDGPITAWGQLCNDLTCDNCGDWVDLSNSDCLQGEVGRSAVNIKTGGLDPFVALVYTPNNECSCQSECQAISGTGCWQLDAARAADAQSYRFVNFGDLGLVCGNTVTNC